MLTLLAILLATPSAQARTYSAPIFAEDEVELRELYTDGVLTEEELELLLELINDPVDVNRARRKELYDLPGITMGMAQRIVQDRKSNGPFASLEQLMRVEGMGAMQVEQLRAFVELAAPTDVAGSVRGYVKAKTAFQFDPVEVIEADHPARTHTPAQLGYGKAPNTYLKGRFKYKKGVDAGIAMLAQDGVTGLAYDPESRDLFAAWGAPGVQFGKAYLHLEDKNRELVAGSFTAGFGAGLTFDTTNRTHPTGLYSDLTLTGTDRFSLRKGLMGVGGGLISQPMGGGTTLDATVFASTNRLDIYMYDVGVAGGEKIDPHLEDEPSPRVWVQAADGTYQRAGYLTLPNLYRESLAGGNATVFFNDRAEVGLTAYVSHLSTAQKTPTSWCSARASRSSAPSAPWACTAASPPPISTCSASSPSPSPAARASWSRASSTSTGVSSRPACATTAPTSTTPTPGASPTPTSTGACAIGMSRASGSRASTSPSSGSTPGSWVMCGVGPPPGRSTCSSMAGSRCAPARRSRSWASPST